MSKVNYLTVKEFAHALALETAVIILAAFTFHAASRLRHNPLTKMEYTSKVRQQMRVLDVDSPDWHHQFPESVAAFGNKTNTTTIRGSDGIVRIKTSIRGEYRGRSGHFEYCRM